VKTPGPTLKRERELLAAGVTRVAGMDEVGRGAFGGPVMVGVCVIDRQTAHLPEGVRDSKLLSPAARSKVVPAIEAWACDFAVGSASASEIDEVGITAALRLAGMRALHTLAALPDVVLLDGSFDWLTPPAVDLFSDAEPFTVRVEMKVKADMMYGSVAAASVLAKEQRDAYMRHLDVLIPGYGWASHVGYGTAQHRAAIDALGLSVEHRSSWKID
jgi:ribonuclease HII